eukprot:4696659-Pyramimonas_sp.AAC.1
MIVKPLPILNASGNAARFDQCRVVVVRVARVKIAVVVRSRVFVVVPRPGDVEIVAVSSYCLLDALLQVDVAAMVAPTVDDNP